VHIVKLSTVVIKVDTKVINASLTQNQCLQCVTTPVTYVEIQYHNRATPLNWTITAWSSWATSTTKQNWFFSIFSKKI